MSVRHAQRRQRHCDGGLCLLVRTWHKFDTHGRQHAGGGAGVRQDWMLCVRQNGRSLEALHHPLRHAVMTGSPTASDWARGSLCATRPVPVSHAAARRAEPVTDTSSEIGGRPPPTNARDQGGPGDEEAGDAAVLLDQDDVDDVFGDADVLDRDEDARPVWARAAAGLLGSGSPYAAGCRVPGAVVSGAGRAPARPACKPCGRQVRHCSACHDRDRRLRFLRHVSIDAALERRAGRHRPARPGQRRRRRT